MIASASAEHFSKAVEILLPSAELDAVIVLYIDVGLADTASMAKSIASRVAELRKLAGAQKPVLACIISAERPECRSMTWTRRR
jgi:acyl-CoA synthetase (NDP forming)